MRERRTIDILGKAYDVLWHDSYGAVGDSDSDGTKINVSREYSEDRQECTMVHEIIESVNAELVLHIDHDTLERLEAGVYDVLKHAGVNLRPLIRE